MWGGVLWRFSNSAYVHPTAPHPRGRATFAITIKLRSNEENPYSQPAGTARQDFIGDSEFILRDTGLPREFVHAVPDIDISAAHVGLIENSDGRLGAIDVLVLDCPRTLDAYRMAQTAFNRLAVDFVLRHGIPLRKTAMLISRTEGSEVTEFAVIAPLGYPRVPAVMNLAHPLPLARLYANYAEGACANSPFYSFLCFFALVEFLTTDLQGRLRRLNCEVPVDFENLAGTLGQEDVRYVGNFLAGTSYSELLEKTRNQRNAVAHFLVERSSRPFNVAAEDQIAFYRDALRLAAHALLAKATRDATRFLAAGVPDRMLLSVFEGRAWPIAELLSLLGQLRDRRRAR